MASITQIGRTASLVVGAVAGLAGISALAALRRPLPRVSGKLRLPGLRAPVQVLRDYWGIPHIYAQSNEDLMAAQGYVHAQDRLWQMELQRRVGFGQLAEVFGPVALPADRLLRILGLNRITRRESELLDDQTRVSIEAYVRGVNAAIEQHAGRLPLEFSILQLHPREWDVADVLVLTKIMALNLSESWPMKILRARIVAAVGAERAAQLDAGYLDDHPFTVPHGVQYSAHIGADALRAAADAAPFTDSAASGQGSNAWAVDGGRTFSGKPLLANDPHLAIQIPGLWYENHLISDDVHVAGASIPGAPGVIIGHNEWIAWGVTNGMTNVQDLYIERFDPNDPQRYEYCGQWEQAEIVHEQIVVRGQAAPHIEEVRITRHGPIISPLTPTDDQPPSASATGPAEELALRWTALDPGHTIRAVSRINRARDWQSFHAALADWSVPAQNFVYADVEGHIGYAFSGDIPIRAQGDGRAPVPGWSGDYEWTGFIPYADLPHMLDPHNGSVVTANNRIVSNDYQYPLHGDWSSGYRATRIQQMLDQTNRHDPSSFAQIQNDTRSLPGLELAALAGRLPAATEIERCARDTLAAWDGDLTSESVGGALYSRLREKLLLVAYTEIAGTLDIVTGLGTFAGLPGYVFLERIVLAQTLRRATQREDAWFKDGRTWDSVLAQAWETTIRELRSEYGDNIHAWRYGRFHQLTLHHPLGVIPVLAKIFNRGPYPIGGDIDTVAMGHLPRKYAGARHYYGASYRQICDTSDWNRSRSSIPPGQSGHPGSRHYTAALQPWLLGEYHPMLWSRARVEEAARHRLTLLPEAATL